MNHTTTEKEIYEATGLTLKYAAKRQAAKGI